MKLINIIYYITLIYILSIISFTLWIGNLEEIPFVLIEKIFGDYANLEKLITGNFKGLKLFDIVTNYFIVIIVSIIIYLLYNYINSFKNTKNKIKRKSYLLNWL